MRTTGHLNSETEFDFHHNSSYSLFVVGSNDTGEVEFFIPDTNTLDRMTATLSELRNRMVESNRRTSD